MRALEDRLCLSGGLLDPTFGGTGEVTLSSSIIRNAGTGATAIQPQDGKIVSVGDVILNKGTTYEMSVVRMNPNGSLDTSFNRTGSIALSVGVYAVADAVAVQPDGKILVGGYAYPTKQALQNYTDAEFVVARFNTNGTLDGTFANRGIFTWNPTAINDSVAALAVLPDGNIVALGGSGGQGAVLKLSAAGALVPSFGKGGLAAIGSANNPAMAVAPNGDLIVGGWDNTGSGAFAYLIAVNQSTGGLDPNFNNGQGEITGFIPPGLNGAKFHAVTVQGNNIIVAGEGSMPGNGVGLLGRFSLTGAVDTTFANGGFYITPGHTYFYDVALELDGSIVVDGRDASGNLPVAHFTASGQIDTSFGGAGTGYALLPNAGGYGGLVVGANGSILAVGSLVYARLNPPEAMIGSFTANPNPVASGGSVTLTASNIAADGGMITQVAFYYYDSTGTRQVLGYASHTRAGCWCPIRVGCHAFAARQRRGGRPRAGWGRESMPPRAEPDSANRTAYQSSPGVWTWTGPINLPAGSYTIYAQAEDSYGVFGDPFASPLTVQ